MDFGAFGHKQTNYRLEPFARCYLKRRAISFACPIQRCSVVQKEMDDGLEISLNRCTEGVSVVATDTFWINRSTLFKKKANQCFFP